jgi:H+-translocating NAD(P) transhydrogenase subunit beta
VNFATYTPSMYFMEATYLVASILFILALKMMSHPETARRGMFLAEGGMFAAIVGTLVGTEIVTWVWLLAGLAIGSIIGAWMAIFVPMTAMPQRTALSHAFGALAAALVGIGEFLVKIDELGPVKRGALGFEIILGALTTTGSLIAASKLQGIIQGKPIQFRGQNLVNMTMFAAMVGCFGYFWYHPTASAVFYSMLGLAFLFGVMLVIPIGSADMPVVMSLLNSYAGLAAAATGFVLGNNVLIIAGTLDGFSGLILSVLMCKAMNRSITNVLFGGFGAVVAEATANVGGVMREINIESRCPRQSQIADRRHADSGSGPGQKRDRSQARAGARLLGAGKPAVLQGLHGDAVWRCEVEPGPPGTGRTTCVKQGLGIRD